MRKIPADFFFKRGTVFQLNKKWLIAILYEQRMYWIE